MPYVTGNANNEEIRESFIKMRAVVCVFSREAASKQEKAVMHMEEIFIPGRKTISVQCVVSMIRETKKLPKSTLKLY